jgi:hypothetical protein
MDKSSLKYLQYTKACSIEDIWYYTKACSIEDIWYLRRVYLTPAEVHWSLTVGPSASGHLCGGKGFRTDRLLCIGKGERTDRLLCMGLDWWASFVLTSHESMPESWVFFSASNQSCIYGWEHQVCSDDFERSWFKMCSSPNSRRSVMHLYFLKALLASYSARYWLTYFADNITNRDK